MPDSKPNTLQIIVGALVTLITGWKKTDSVSNDVEDALILLSTAHAAGIGGSFVGAAQKIVGQTAAGLSNLESGQAAVIASDKGYTAVIFKNGGPAAQSLGLA